VSLVTVAHYIGYAQFYKVISDPFKLRGETIKWIKDAVKVSKPRDSIIVVLLSHGDSGGSVIIGGDPDVKDDPFIYLTKTDIRMAASENRFIHAASKRDQLAFNFRSHSGKYRRGVFVITLIESLRKDRDGKLSVLVSEVRKEVTDECLKSHPNVTNPTVPMSAVSRHVLWDKKIQAFIPVTDERSVQEVIMDHIIETTSFNLNPNLTELYQNIRPAKRRLSDELADTIRQTMEQAYDAGGSNGEDKVYDIYREVLEGDAPVVATRRISRTIFWRESTALQVYQIARKLHQEGIIGEKYSIQTTDSDGLLAAIQARPKRWVLHAH
jgi:hypothetical protein